MEYIIAQMVLPSIRSGSDLTDSSVDGSTICAMMYSICMLVLPSIRSRLDRTDSSVLAFWMRHLVAVHNPLWTINFKAFALSALSFFSTRGHCVVYPQLLQGLGTLMNIIVDGTILPPQRYSWQLSRLLCAGLAMLGKPHASQ
jgi:hypothetical protein